MFMKNLLYISSFAAASLLFSSCGVNVLHGEGKKITEMPTVGNFNAVEVNISSNVEVTVTEGAACGVEVSGYANILKHIKTEVKDNVLCISYDLDHTLTIDGDDTKVRVTVPSLKAVSMSGAPDVDIKGDIKGPEFALDISGAGGVTIENIHADVLDADISGAAKLEIKGGVVKTAKYELSGAGSIEAFPLQTEETITSISGTASNEVSASRKLTADISGAGSVEYKGNPEVVKHVSGVGEVTAVK